MIGAARHVGQQIQVAHGVGGGIQRHEHLAAVVQVVEFRGLHAELSDRGAVVGVVVKGVGIAIRGLVAAGHVAEIVRREQAELRYVVGAVVGDQTVRIAVLLRHKAAEVAVVLPCRLLGLERREYVLDEILIAGQVHDTHVLFVLQTEAPHLAPCVLHEAGQSFLRRVVLSREILVGEHAHHVVGQILQLELVLVVLYVVALIEGFLIIAGTDDLLIPTVEVVVHIHHAAGHHRLGLAGLQLLRELAHVVFQIAQIAVAHPEAVVVLDEAQHRAVAVLGKGLDTAGEVVARADIVQYAAVCQVVCLPDLLDIGVDIPRSAAAAHGDKGAVLEKDVAPGITIVGHGEFRVVLYVLDPHLHHRVDVVSVAPHHVVGVVGVDELVGADDVVGHVLLFAGDLPVLDELILELRDVTQQVVHHIDVRDPAVHRLDAQGFTGILQLVQRFLRLEQVVLPGEKEGAV